MKGKKRSECPICREKISAEPVHSLALDNAISKLVEKLDPEAKAEREELLKTYTESLKTLTSSKENVPLLEPRGLLQHRDQNFEGDRQWFNRPRSYHSQYGRTLGRFSHCNRNSNSR